MKKILVIDTNQGFTSDLERNLIINELEDIEIYTKNSIDQALLELDSISPDEIVIPVIMISAGNWDLDIPVITFARNNEDIFVAHNTGFKCYGIAKKAADLLGLIEKGQLLEIQSTSNKETAEESHILKVGDAPYRTKEQGQSSISQSREQSKRKKGKPQNKADDNDVNSQRYKKQNRPQNNHELVNNQFSREDYNPQHNKEQDTRNYPYPMKEKIYEVSSEYLEDGVQNRQKQEHPQGLTNRQYGIPRRRQGCLQNEQWNEQWDDAENSSYIDSQHNNMQNNEYHGAQGAQYSDDYSDYDREMAASQFDKYYPNEEISNNMNPQSTMYVQGSNVYGMRARMNDRINQDYRMNEQYNARLAQNQFDSDMGYLKKPARCIAVYSAKGGVGKTTLSCELATFLALTAHGRGKFKVCIADFNIDFGDVLNTLSFDAAGANMTTWAADIRERIHGGENPAEINYPEARIMTWLQKNEKDGLYALLAPITNADSTEIGEQEIEVMLNNLIHNCGFDFVICDTGNNTRDSSFIALEKADDILLVLTQSVNTANCNNSFLVSANRLGFNMNKFKIIINNVKPAKLVGISTEELETIFRNPYTNRPYECIAKIKSSNDVTSSGNLGEPLAYNSSHEFTRSIGEIVHKLTGGQTVLQKSEKKKKNWFSFWKKK